MALRSTLDDGYPIVELDSDSESVDSSDDEIQVILQGTPEQKRRLRRRSLGCQSSSGEDDFEKQMEAELNQTMDSLQDRQKLSVSPKKTNDTEKAAPEYYDNDYFDSDSDDEGTSTEKGKRKHCVMSNDDLLYDPNMDNEDQRWVDHKRSRYQPKAPPGARKSDKAQPKKLPNSDAVLNCPACMSLLCLDCQRHSMYKNQYRAMFVSNCSVNRTEMVAYPTANKNKKTKNKKQKGAPSASSSEADSAQSAAAAAAAAAGAEDEGQQGLSSSSQQPDKVKDAYHPVHCTVCNTEVAVFDNDEVYHFFNVLSSYT